MTNEMQNELEQELIHVQDDSYEQLDRAEDAGRRRIEEISVRGGELRDTLGRLAQEGRARKITLRDRHGKTLIEIPLLLGAAGVLILGPATAALLAAAWLTRVSILIEYEDAPAIDDLPAVKQIEPRIA